MSKIKKDSNKLVLRKEIGKTVKTIQFKANKLPKQKRLVERGQKSKLMEKRDVFENSENDDDLPLDVRLNKVLDKSTICPQMKESSIKKLQEILQYKELDESKLSLNKCVSQMRSTTVPHIYFLNVLRKAIVSSLLERRWDNLVELLMMLVDNSFSSIFTHFVREICEIMCHLDPRVAGTELEDQLTLIKIKYETKKDTMSNVV